MIGDLLETFFHWRPSFIGDLLSLETPHGCLVGEPQILDGDSQIFIEDPRFSF